MKSLFISLSLILILMGCNNQPNVATINPSSSDTAILKLKVTQASSPSLFSEITCPKCGHIKTEKLPTEVCQVSYTCENCKVVIHPKNGDCCVYCTYGTHKCPSKQDNL